MNSAFANWIQVSLISVKYARTMRYLALLVLFPVIASGGEIYTRDGVTDGDTFYLAPRAWADDDPVLQSWVAYSLMKSTCQLEIGGDNPARKALLAAAPHRSKDAFLKNLE